MNREQRIFKPAVLTVVLGAVCLLARCPAAEPAAKAAPEAPKTLEAQLEYLEGALSEGLRTQDWKMVELACTGYKASGLKDKDLELSITRAERDAALDVLRAYTGMGTGHIAPFGLGARTILGDAAAHAKLHSWGFDDLPEVKVPDQTLYQTQPAEADKQMRAYQGYQQDLTRQENALLTLALLKEPGVLDRIFARLSSKPSHKGYATGMLYNNDTLILAALAADPDQGYKKLLALASDEKGETASTTQIMSSLVGLKGYAKIGGEAKFSLRGDLAGKLPADFYPQIAKPFVALLQRWKPDEKQQGFDMSLNSLLNISYQLPKGTLDHDALTTIASLKDKVNDQQGWMKQQIDQLLKMQGFDPNTAQKPPAPPKDF